MTLKPQNGGRFSAEQLLQFARSVYITLGVPGADAELLADTLVQADLWGHSSHGVMRTFWYAQRLKTGAMKPATQAEIVTDAGAIAVLDGHDGIGQVIAALAMDEALARAREHGIGAVAVRNSGHFGTAMYFTRRATLSGCMGLIATNASPAMAPSGGRVKLIGTNPWSIAAPTGRYSPMVLDIANTAVARGKLYMARQRGDRIPDGWAIDEKGMPTNDAAAGIAGAILPMSGHKGYAIATMMDVLSGILAGGLFGGTITGPYVPEGRSGAGHFVMAIDIASLRPLADFTCDMEALIERIKAVPRAAGVDEIFYPGEPEARAEERHRKDGIEIPATTLAELDDGSCSLGLPPLSASGS